MTNSGPLFALPMGNLSTPSQLHSNYGRMGKFDIFGIAKIIFWRYIWPDQMTHRQTDDQFWASICLQATFQPPLNCILIIGERGNFKFLVQQKLYIGATFGPIRSPMHMQAHRFWPLFTLLWATFQPPLNCILIMGEGGNFKFLIQQKSYIGAAFWPIR